MDWHNPLMAFGIWIGFKIMLDIFSFIVFVHLDVWLLIRLEEKWEGKKDIVCTGKTRLLAMTISDYIRYLSQRSACFDTTESTTKSNNNSSELVAKTASNETNKVANTINATVIP